MRARRLLHVVYPWSSMATRPPDLQPGDYVIHRDGRRARVLEVDEVNGAWWARLAIDKELKVVLVSSAWTLLRRGTTPPTSAC